MQCKKCNAELIDGAEFCPVCGEVVSAEPNMTPENAEVPVKKVKSKKKRVVLLSVVGVLLVLTVLGCLFWRTILFAFAPEKYTALVVSDTIEQLAEEMEIAEKNLIGFNVTMEKDFTVSASVEENMTKTRADVVLSNDTKNKQLIGESSINAMGKEYNMFMFLDNKYAGASFPNSNGEYVVVPSKNIGAEILDSNGVFGKYANNLLSDEQKENLRQVDMSYDALQGATSDNEEAMEKLTEIITDEVLGFLDKCEISGRESTEITIGGEKVSANKITVKANTYDVLDAIVALADSVAKDKDVRACLGESTAISLTNWAEIAKRAKKEVPNETFTIEMYEYDGKLAQIVIVDDELNKATISFTDKEHLINGINISVETAKGESLTIEMKTNLATESRKIYVETAVALNASGKSVDLKMRLDFDFDSEVLKSKFSFNGTEFEFKGTCKKQGDKFSFEFPARIGFATFNFSFKLEPGVKVTNKRSESNYVHMLQWSEADARNYLFRMAQNLR